MSPKHLSSGRAVMLELAVYWVGYAASARSKSAVSIPSSSSRSCIVSGRMRLLLRMTATPLELVNASISNGKIYDDLT